MKKTKKSISVLLCVALALGTTACSGSNNPESTTSATTTVDDDIRNPVNVDDFVEEDTLENPNLTYLGYYDMRVAGDIKPGVKLFEETYGGKIDYMQVNWAERIDKLQVMVSTGDSPDLVDREPVSFPFLMSQNVYTDMTNYIDLSEPQWEGYEDLIERYSWNGKHYYYPFTVNALPNCLIYNADLFVSLGLDNPKELYDKGEWDWNSFKAIMSDFIRANDDAIGGVYGIVSSDIMITTGTPLVEINDGKVINNFSNVNIDRAANFLMELRKEGYAVRGDGMWSNEPAPLANGKVAFLGVGQWKITDFCKDYPDQNYEFVPYPKDPSADKYYYNTSAFGYMVPSGAPNPEGAAAFINIMRKCQTDPELRAVVDQSILTDKQYSEEQFEFLKSFEEIENFDLVLESYGGFNSDLTDLIDTMLVNVAFDNEENKGWTQLRTENEGTIQAVLDEYNQ